MKRRTHSSGPSKSFYPYAIIVALLLLICWPISLIMNVIWYFEAVAAERETRNKPEGKGCLLVLLILSLGLLILIVMGLITGWSREFLRAINL